MGKKIGICRYCNLEKTLIDSHIIPKSFYDLKKQGPYVTIDYKESKLDKVHGQNGFKEPLLCAECDNKLGILDRYAKYFLYTQVPNVPLEYSEDIPLVPFYALESNSFNFTLLRRFFISLLWRASICSEIPISLGHYENIALRILKREQIDNENLFIPLIYRKETNTPADFCTTIVRYHFIGESCLYFRFPYYEVIILTDTDACNNKLYARQLQQLFSRQHIKIYKLVTNTPLDRCFYKSMQIIQKKYSRMRPINMEEK